MNDPVEDSPASLFVKNLLQQAVDQGVEQIVFERRLNPQGKPKVFNVMFEAGEPVAAPPLVLWEPVISRLKVMARMVDYGPNKSESGEFQLHLPDGRTAEFEMKSNPNPHVDNKVTLIRKDISHTQSDDYQALKKAFLKAAMPGGESDIEHTFGLFLRKFEQHFESRLRKRMSAQGITALRKASIDESMDTSGDSPKFGAAMDLMTQQVAESDFAAATKTTIKAYDELYSSRRNRYEAILENLTDIDRAVVRAEYLDKVSLTIEPSELEDDRQVVVLSIDIPGEAMTRISRHYSYFLSNGIPKMLGQESTLDGFLGTAENIASRGD